MIGGDLSIRWVSDNTYEIQMRVFRDCIGGEAPMPFNVEIGIYRLNDDVLQQKINLPRQTLNVDLPFDGDPCFSPSNLCVDEGIFVRSVTIPDNPDGYYIHSQIFARNYLSENIAGNSEPNARGMSFYMEFPDPALGENSSPVFGDYPKDAFFCQGTPKTFNFDVTDPDGDSLVYSLTQPLDAKNVVRALNATWNITNPGPYDVVPWMSGYSIGNVVGGSPPMAIDASTGDISAAPDLIGIYTFAILVEEYRNGIKIGETRRDIQYAALECIQNSPQEFLSDWDDGDTIFVNPDQRYCYDFIFHDVDGDQINMEVNSPTFNYGATMPAIDPYQGGNNYLFTYNNGEDSIFTTESSFDQTTNTFTNNDGTVAFKYCWSPVCEAFLTDHYTNISFNSTSFGCSDTNYQSINLNLKLNTRGTTPTLLPNVFSPNGDGKNDVFSIYGYTNPCTDTIETKIYNRWGKLVFESEETDFEWDGKNKNNEDCSNGTYFVILTGVYGEKRIEQAKYLLTLFR